MKLGATQWTFKFSPPYDQALTVIAGLGLRSVELVVWNEEDLQSYYTDETVRQLRTQACDLGLEIAEFVGTPEDLAHPDRSKRDNAIAYFEKVARVAKALGTSIVNSMPPFPFALRVPGLSERLAAQEWRVDYPSGLDWKANWDAYVEACKRCAQICEEAGLRWAIEPHPFTYVSNTASMLRLLDQVASPALGCNVDPSHLLPVGDTPHVAVYQLGDRVFNCHLSDNWGDGAHFRPGKGKIDWVSFLVSLREVGFGGSLSLELADSSKILRGVPRTADGDGVASPSFWEEHCKAIGYLDEVAKAAGVPLDHGAFRS